jgi:FtsH ternary system-associated peptide
MSDDDDELGGGPYRTHDEDDEDELPTVAASEAELVTMARALTAPHAYDVWSLLASSRSMPAKIGPTAAGLVGDALGQVWPALWKRDGARPGASIERGRVKRGRGWERHAVSPLTYSPATLAFLRWLVGSPLASAGNIDKLARMPLQIGDQVVVYLALDIAAGTPAQSVIARQPFVQATPLAWLGFPSLMTGTDVPDLEMLVTGPGAVVVEALTQDLATKWRATELSKRTMTDPEPLVALGATQDAILTELMDACDGVGRRDLAMFVIDAALPLLERGIAPIPTDLDMTKPLSVRAAARAAAGALLRGVQRWRDWDDRHRGVRFLDDDYEAAQMLLARFERVGRGGVDRAAQWLSELASLAPTTPAPAATVEPP